MTIREAFERILRGEPEGVTEKDVGAVFVTYRIGGPAEYVAEQLRLLFARYHRLGYGTSLQSMERTDNGTWHAVVRRATSCE